MKAKIHLKRYKIIAKHWLKLILGFQIGIMNDCPEKEHSISPNIKSISTKIKFDNVVMVVVVGEDRPFSVLIFIAVFLVSSQGICIAKKKV